MKILLLTDDMDPGGVQRHVTDLANRLSARGHGVWLLASNGPFRHRLQPSVAFVDLPMVRRGARSLSSAVKALGAILQLARTEGIEVVHTHMRYTDLLGRIGARMQGIPHVSTCHSLFSGGRLWSFFGQETIAVSKMVEHMLVHSFGKHRSHVTTILHDMEEPDRMPARHTDALKRVHGIRKARVVFFYVGRFVPEKDPLICVEAMKILRQEGTLDGIVCAMAGYGPLRDRIQNTIDADELKDHVVLLPGTANIHEIVNMCSFGIVPSRSEGGIPYIVLEAASLGKPVIASTAGALTEFVRHNVNGVLVAPGEAQHLAEAIRLLANDRRLVGKLGAAARKDFQRHRGDKSADLILSVYRKVLAA